MRPYNVAFPPAFVEQLQREAPRSQVEAVALYYREMEEARRIHAMAVAIQSFAGGPVPGMGAGAANTEELMERARAIRDFLAGDDVRSLAN